MSQHGCPERLSNRSKGFQEESAGQATMEVLVETLTGTAFEMTVSPSDTIFAIKSKIFRVEGIPVSQQHLVYNLKELDDGASLRALGIGDGARLRLVLGMRGGPISTRRLPPPPSDISGELERLLGSNRYRETSWSGGSGASGSSGCKVTVLVFRDGERVNMLRVRENRDGSLQPLEHAKYSSSLSALPAGASVAEGGARDNAVTMNKMLDLRRRMEALSVQRRPSESKAEIQKTRSEEILSVPSLLDETRPYSPYSEADDGFAPLYDGHYTRYDYDCAFDRYTLLPPIGTRAESEQSVESVGGVMEGGAARRGGGDDERLDAADDTPLPHAHALPNHAAPEYGPLVGGWRSRGFGSSSALSPGVERSHPAHSASLTLLPAPLATALFSSSTSDLEALRRNMAPLTRHRPTDHLHLSDERLAPKPEPRRRSQRLRFDSFEDVKNEVEKEPQKKDKKVTRIRCGFCKKRLSIATVHKCRCGAEFCAPHRYAEVHGCAYDYKANAHQYLQRANPLVSAPKLPKI